MTSRLGIVYVSGAPIETTVPSSTVYARGFYSARERNGDWSYDNQRSAAGACACGTRAG